VPKKSDPRLVRNLEIEKHLDLIVSRDKIDLAESSLLIQKLGDYFGRGRLSSKSNEVILKTELFLSSLYDQADQETGDEALKDAILKTQSYSSYLAYIVIQELDRKEIVRDDKFYYKMKQLGAALIHLGVNIGAAKSRFKP
jgi:hypothetical protein